MKTNPYLRCVVLALVWNFVPAATGEEKPAAVPELPAKFPKAISGVIVEKDEKRMLMKRDDGQGDLRVVLADSVLITNGELPGTLKDLVPGVRVEVKVKDGTQEAVSIKILGPEPKVK